MHGRIVQRLVAATNRDLEESIDRGVFREDLYHRFKVVTIALPRLADRREDIGGIEETPRSCSARQ